MHESRHRFVRAIWHDRGGNIMQAHRECHEDQLAALGLVPNTVVLCTT